MRGNVHFHNAIREAHKSMFRLSMHISTHDTTTSVTIEYKRTATDFTVVHCKGINEILSLFFRCVRTLLGHTIFVGLACICAIKAFKWIRFSRTNTSFAKHLCRRYCTWMGFVRCQCIWNARICTFVDLYICIGREWCWVCMHVCSPLYEWTLWIKLMYLESWIGRLCECTFASTKKKISPHIDLRNGIAAT